MTGSPIFRTWLAALSLAALSLLLFKLTAAAPALIAGPDMNASAEAPVAIRLRLRCSQLPQSLKLMSGPQTLAELSPPAGLRWEGTTSLPIPPEGLELTLTADWPQDSEGEKAISLELEPDGRDAQSSTVWTDTTELTEYLDYQWK